MIETKESIRVSPVYADNPFGGRVGIGAAIVDLKMINKLSEQGRFVLVYVVENLLTSTEQTKLNATQIATEAFGRANATNTTKVRRGIKNLLNNKVIGRTTCRGVYWVNKAIIWT